MSKHNQRLFFFSIIIIFVLTLREGADLHAQAKVPLRIGVAGTAPFVVGSDRDDGISLEIWQALADKQGWSYSLIPFDDVPHALQALEAGRVDAVVGPVSITADRASKIEFTQPYFQSGLSIMSRAKPPTVWERIRPFFTTRFFIAVLVFLFILGIVGTLLWLAEREHNPDQFPSLPARGIANGMWCAIVTMSTTGYGDRAPVTFWGRVVAGSWMVISIIFATTMVATIASTLTLVGMNTVVISNADQLNDKTVGVVAGSPAQDLIEEYGGREVPIMTLEQGYKLLKEKRIDAVVYDRPQLLYFEKQHHDHDVSISKTEYMRQGYGFAFPLKSQELHEADIALLRLQESGRISRIVKEWLGENG